MKLMPLSPVSALTEFRLFRVLNEFGIFSAFSTFTTLFHMHLLFKYPCAFGAKVGWWYEILLDRCECVQTRRLNVWA